MVFKVMCKWCFHGVLTAFHRTEWDLWWDLMGNQQQWFSWMSSVGIQNPCWLMLLILDVFFFCWGDYWPALDINSLGLITVNWKPSSYSTCAMTEDLERRSPVIWRFIIQNEQTSPGKKQYMGINRFGFSTFFGRKKRTEPSSIL